MARNLAVEATRHVAAGRPTVDAEEKARRLEICQACPRFRPCDERCSVCGCKMRIKTSWELAECPEGKW